MAGLDPDNGARDDGPRCCLLIWLSSCTETLIIGVAKSLGSGAMLIFLPGAEGKVFLFIKDRW